MRDDNTCELHFLLVAEDGFVDLLLGLVVQHGVGFVQQQQKSEFGFEESSRQGQSLLFTTR
jgi:hypothetical protein